MADWEYRKIDLNQQHPRSDELELLNAAGAHGWELISITNNNIAYLKRPLEEVAGEKTYSDALSLAQHASGKGDEERDRRGEKVKVKYRDPRTNETWSGRGRMATWLKRKQDAGEDIEIYLV